MREIAKIDTTFAEQIKNECGENVYSCYQCKKCTLGCPTAYAMRYKPHQLIEAIQLGQKDLVLKDQSIWLCLSCQTCMARCPQNLDFVKVADAARIIAQREGFKIPVPEIAAFNSSFLSLVERFGRIYEIGLVMLIKLKTKQIMKDMAMGLPLFFKGKFSFLPHKVENISAVRRIFRNTKELEQK
ncbi:4Fe-4S dicluster domain-containing protein [Candidatus Oleimmundimicrobium sp.]|uniref:4Fe-4S dicluster domain-containing protein n=1 Tax=Candidatus Oleimmundimicrobium sp. TaxID=3060597 RepID=UPI00271BB09D|nr:4Fe-4S dicluster domain-containing protein [Candidatus Oleimmundimicrobium sp.]MDO8886267.1 4Fe-4S dicluster domain-containing protein [Candidatus Oleimmundimicrobium sp.]